MVLQGESNQLYESLSASSVRLSLGDFFIKGNPNDVNKLRNACESIHVFNPFQKNKGKSFAFNSFELFDRTNRRYSCPLTGLTSNSHLKEGEWEFGKQFYVKFMQLFLYGIDHVGFFRIKK